MKRHNHLTSVIVGVVLLTLALLGSAFVALAPSFYALENIQISPTAGVVLGHKALGQKPGYFSADQQHLKVRYDSKQAAWYLTNVSANKKVLAKLTGGGSLFLKTGYLQVGDTIYLDDQHIRITQLKPLQFDLIESGKSSKITWDNGELTREGIRNFAGCDKAWWKTLLGHDQGFTLGGKVQCVDRLKIHNIPLASAKIDKDEQGYYLRPLNNQIYIGFQQLEHRLMLDK